MLIHVLGTSLRLLHPFMPFITEEIYTKLPGAGETIMLSEWPVSRGNVYPEECRIMENMMEMIRSIRNVRAEMQVAPAQKIEINLVAGAGTAEEYNKLVPSIARLIGAGSMRVYTDKAQAQKNDIHLICADLEAFIPLKSLIDPQKELERVRKEIEKAQADFERAMNKLSNESFTSKAPEKDVQAEQTKAEQARTMIDKLTRRAAELETMV